MQELGASGLHVRKTPAGCGLVLDVWAAGFAGTPADYKQFRYGALGGVIEQNVATVVVSDLDHIRPPDDRISQFERPLGGGWWVEYVSYP